MAYFVYGRRQSKVVPARLRTATVRLPVVHRKRLRAARHWRRADCGCRSWSTSERAGRGAIPADSMSAAQSLDGGDVRRVRSNAAAPGGAEYAIRWKPTTADPPRSMTHWRSWDRARGTRAPVQGRLLRPAAGHGRGTPGFATILRRRARAGRATELTWKLRGDVALLSGRARCAMRARSRPKSTSHFKQRGYGRRDASPTAAPATTRMPPRPRFPPRPKAVTAMVTRKVAGP